MEQARKRAGKTKREREKLFRLKREREELFRLIFVYEMPAAGKLTGARELVVDRAPKRPVR